ncbi:hypothetical protein IAS59_006013 [Cryptococcus gattii]
MDSAQRSVSDVNRSMQVLTAANNIGISHNNISLYLDNYIFVLLHTSHLLLPPQAYVALLAPYSLRETKLQQGCPRQILLAESSVLEVIGLTILLQSRLSVDKHFSLSFFILL